MLLSAALALPSGCTHATQLDGIQLVDVAPEAGIDFRHESGRTGALRLPEIIGAGVAILDYDGDGRMDVYLVQGGPLPGDESGVGSKPTDRLYRNVGGPGEMRFEDVTEAVGLTAGDYGMGIATGDIDNDGDTDLFRTAFGRNRLLINDSGRFVDRTDVAGIAGNEWSISASFADIDGDGLLDLYVANYLAYDMASPACETDGRPRYCPPSHYVAVPDRLYRNLGGGRFEDVSAAWRIATEGVANHAAMGVASADFDRDGRADFFVANDGTANRVWMNRGGHFEDIAFEAGAAVNADGEAEAGMGVAIADLDSDGDSDVFLTHDVAETNTLYVNESGGALSLPDLRFVDQSARLGVAASSVPFTGFGTGALDIENDGDLDLYIANGPIADFRPGALAPTSLHNLLLVNAGNARFQTIPHSAHQDTSRGAAFGDLDNDGDIDIAVANNHGPARLYRNDSRAANWLGIAVRSKQGQRNAIAATVLRLTSPQLRRVHTDSSYASAQDPRIVFGLGKDDQPQFVRIRWPNGKEQTFGPLPINRYHTLTPN